MTKKFAIIAILGAAVAAFSACDDGKSYAELLDDETVYVNRYLADNLLSLENPTDTNFVFITGEDAPFYPIGTQGGVYMQVLEPGTRGNWVRDNEQIYFRFTRWPLASYDGKLHDGQGNNISLSPYWFRYNNFYIESSYTWGRGIQLPLSLLPIDCKVRLIVKAAQGPTSEEANVQPYLWELTYERRQ